MSDVKPVRQCKTCPWRQGANVDDIPRYRRDLHEALADTIQSGLDGIGKPLKIMACHYSTPGHEAPCAGWLHNQLGDGNNIALRIRVAAGRLPPPAVDGPQKATFEETLR